MVRLVICNNLECKKYKECYHAMSEIGDNCIINLKHVCNELNNYKYKYEIGDKPIRKEELSE